MFHTDSEFRVVCRQNPDYVCCVQALKRVLSYFEPLVGAD